MVGEYSRFPTSSLLRSAVLSGIYRATHLDIEYLRHCSVDFNFDLINEKIWNNNWVITKITGNILPGEYVLLGSAIRGFSKKENFILTRCIQRIGNCLVFEVGQNTSPIIVHEIEVHPAWSAKINFSNKAAPKSPENLPKVSLVTTNSSGESNLASEQILTKSHLKLDKLDSVNITINEPSYSTNPGMPDGRIAEAIRNRTTSIKLGDFDDIKFENSDLFLEQDVLITKYGIPLIISDFHSKDTVHLPLLAALGLIPNEIPTMDWLDAHHDKYFPEKLPRKLKEANFPLTLAQAKAITRRMNVGWAAFFLNVQMFDIVDQASRIMPMPEATAVNLFETTNPFARKIKGRTHILNFDLDLVVDYIANYEGQPQRNMEEKADEFFRFLISKGLKKQNYDAMLIYTSPYWSGNYQAIRIALNWIKKIVDN